MLLSQRFRARHCYTPSPLDVCWSCVVAVDAAVDCTHCALLDERVICLGGIALNWSSRLYDVTEKLEVANGLGRACYRDSGLLDVAYVSRISPIPERQSVQTLFVH